MNAGHFWDIMGFVEFRGDVFSIGNTMEFFVRLITNLLR